MSSGFNCFVKATVVFFVLAVIAAALLPAYTDYSPGIAANEALSSVKSLQTEIAEKVAAQKSVLGAGLGIKASRSQRGDEVTVLPDGSIIVRVAEHGQVFALIPRYADGAVAWKCIADKKIRRAPEVCRRTYAKEPLRQPITIDGVAWTLN